MLDALSLTGRDLQSRAKWPGLPQYRHKFQDARRCLSSSLSLGLGPDVLCGANVLVIAEVADGTDRGLAARVQTHVVFRRCGYRSALPTQ